MSLGGSDELEATNGSRPSRNLGCAASLILMLAGCSKPPIPAERPDLDAPGEPSRFEIESVERLFSGGYAPGR